RVLAHQPGALQARVHRRVPLLFRRLDGVVREVDAGIVEEDVEPAAERLQRLGHEALTVARLRDVAANENCGAAGGFDRGHDLSPPPLVPAGHDALRALLGEGARRGLAETRGGASDDADTVLELSTHCAPATSLWKRGFLRSGSKLGSILSQPGER